MSKTSDMVRKEFKAGDDVRDAGLTTPDDIRRYDDILYGEDTGWHRNLSFRQQSRIRTG